MTDEEKEAIRLHKKLYDAAFSFYLWSLPVGTPPGDIVALANHLALYGDQQLQRYKSGKRIAQEVLDGQAS